jgi:hypothetical protein
MATINEFRLRTTELMLRYCPLHLVACFLCGRLLTSFDSFSLPKTLSCSHGSCSYGSACSRYASDDEQPNVLLSLSDDSQQVTILTSRSDAFSCTIKSSRITTSV